MRCFPLYNKASSSAERHLESFENTPDSLDLPVVGGDGDVFLSHIVGVAHGHLFGHVTNGRHRFADPRDELLEGRLVGQCFMHRVGDRPVWTSFVNFPCLGEQQVLLLSRHVPGLLNVSSDDLG